MIHALVILSLALVATTEDSIITVEVKRRENVILPCVAKSKPGVEYVAVRWYKEGVDPRLTGLVTKDLPDGRMRWYVGASMEISLVNGTLNLRLPNVSCSDSGVYQCYLAAPVGQQNREGHIRLTVTDCPREVEKTPVTLKTNLNDGYLVVFGAVGVLFASLVVFLLSYRSLRNTLKLKNKTPGKEKYPDPNSRPEKQELIWISTLGPSPKKSEPKILAA